MESGTLPEDFVTNIKTTAFLVIIVSAVGDVGVEVGCQEVTVVQEPFRTNGVSVCLMVHIVGIDIVRTVCLVAIVVA